MALSGFPWWFGRWRSPGRSSALASCWRNGLGIALLCCGPYLINSVSAELRPSLAQQYPRAENAPLVLLGQALFRSTDLSADGTVSCSTCHIASLGYSGDRPRAIGVSGYTARRRAPALLGLRDTPQLMWDGRAPGLPAQVLLPLEGAEMAVAWPRALRELGSDPDIVRLLDNAHIDSFDRDTVVTALASYVASLDAGRSRFDRFYYDHDQDALSSQEALGLRLFVHKAGCATCHLLSGEPAHFTDGSFHVTGFGAAPLSSDHGRAEVTGAPADEKSFKTPGLRAVALRPYLMHDGSMTSLREVVERYNRADRLAVPNLDARLKPLFLSKDEVNAIVAFLGALTPESMSSSEPGNIAKSQ